jgi:hypothetical protein
MKTCRTWQRNAAASVACWGCSCSCNIWRSMVRRTRGLTCRNGDAEETQGRLLGRWQARLSRAAMWALMAGGVQLASGHGVQAADERSGWGSGLQPLTCVSRATCVVAAATGAVVVVAPPAGVAVVGGGVSGSGGALVGGASGVVEAATAVAAAGEARRPSGWVLVGVLLCFFERLGNGSAVRL